MHPGLIPLVADIREVFARAGVLARDELPPELRGRSGYSLNPTGDFELEICWTMLNADYGTVVWDRRSEVMAEVMATLLSDAGYEVKQLHYLLEGARLRVHLFTSPERVQRAVRAARWEGATDVPWPTQENEKNSAQERQLA